MSNDQSSWEEQLVAHLQHALGIEVCDRTLYRRAFTNRAFLPEDERRESYEKLEFLGDRLLGVVIAEHLYDTLDVNYESVFAQVQDRLACAEALAELAERFGFFPFIRLGGTWRHDTITSEQREIVLADVLEAFIGALYKDQGRDVISRFIEQHFFPRIPVILQEGNLENAKHRLIKHLQRQGKAPEFRLLATRDKTREDCYMVGVYVDGGQVAIGEGRSRKRAERFASEKALKKFNGQEN